MSDTEKLKSAVTAHSRIVFFGGAGVSTESGIPDFRGAGGLYTRDISAEELLSYSYFKAYPERFYEFYRAKLLYPDAKPNFAHIYLAELEQEGKLSAVITQNVDGLHQAAGSKNVIELHGTAHKAECDKCRKPHPADAINVYGDIKSVPRCDCGGVIRPCIIMYEEPLDESVMSKAVGAIADADMLIIAGTSLSVYPAAGFIRYFKGDCIAVINKTPVPLSGADIMIQGSIAETFKEISDAC